MKKLRIHLQHQGAACAVLLFYCLFLAACTAGKHSAETMRPAAQEELLMPSGAVLSWDTFAEQVQGTDYILIGETHTAVCDHLMQARIIQQLAERAGSVPWGIGLEMVSVEKQAVLDRFNQGHLTVDELAVALDWEHSWGFAYALYAPVFEQAAQHNLPLIALNAPRGLVRTASRGGIQAYEQARQQLPQTISKALPVQILPPPQAQVPVLERQFRQHQAMRGKDPSAKDSESTTRQERFFLIQSLWDTTMAHNAHRARTTKGLRQLVILAGSGHVQYKWGIAHRLSQLDPAGTQHTIMPWSPGRPPISPRSPRSPNPAVAGDSFFLCEPAQKSRIGLTLRETPEGIAVREVAEKSRAERAGILPGDVLLEAQGLPLQSLSALHKAAIKARQQKRPLRVTIQRGTLRQTVVIKK